MTDRKIGAKDLVEGARAEVISLAEHINYGELRLKDLADLFDDIVRVASDARDRLRAGNGDHAA